MNETFIKTLSISRHFLESLSILSSCNLAELQLCIGSTVNVNPQPALVLGTEKKENGNIELESLRQRAILMQPIQEKVFT